MWLAIIVAVVALAIAAVRLGFVPPLSTAILIRIRDGRAEVTKGRLRADIVASVSRIVEDGGVKRGFVAISVRERVRFSFTVPSGIRQRVRNVLLNRW